MTCVVNGMCDEFLPRAGFPLDEDSRIGGSHLFYLFENRFQGGAGVPGLKCASGEERHWTRRAYGTR